ncbi:MAG: BON domain-containing protein [Actinomycetota bacterium]
MERPAEEAPHYLIQRIREALVHDPRVGELELGVKLRGGHVFVTGTVHTDERRRAVSQVVREVAPDLEIHNQVTVVAALSGTDDVETVS